MKTVYLLNGPNLNMLGKREPGIYGADTLVSIEADCISFGKTIGMTVECRQSNHEGQLIDWIHEAGEKAAGIVFNPGAYTHTSVALHDAIKSVPHVPVVEIHLTNVHAREAFRQKSYISPVAIGVICGFGPLGYQLALRALAERLG
ncbi:type II 3-dehydroquinate dehydratase [Limoniibacter endophyticus]|uniref:3-dehydroquinate dehydratase n=1 Tax=Limoniibacter endophyticus TaxID=1565040 RepID=A0A8J3GF86_9HYPH|nr:type II 3-dehydroquinate dehydratase [Limoniibacter endophyticus]GHC61088.1 3-dehydroquinate dehydratase [Limoniibacter endophyticus]